MPTTAQVRLKLPDGSDYGFTGTVEFSQVIVDQGTGTVTIRARFPNPQSILLPGMFVTAQFAQAIQTVGDPRPAAGGHARPAGQCDPVRRRPRQPSGPAHGQSPTGRMGTYWVVTGGLAPGEKVITQGTANLKDGAPIKPVPASAPQRVKAPPPGAMKARTARQQRG